jgi:asparagine synthase (glutamine-hydrolysing)
MCGIAGIINFNGVSDVQRERVRRATQMLSHRGPDAEGLWLAPSGLACLGHRRLSIIDLSSRANQPLVLTRAGVSAVFNGEIYNYQSLRSQLAGLSHRFDTESDTEVLLRSYLEYGTGLFDHVRGMFAFGIWDERNRRLLLARDFCGQKPLFYRVSGRFVAFASEIGALGALSPDSSDLDVDALDLYCKYWCVPPPRTLVKGLNKLPAAHYSIFDGEQFATRRYWFPIRQACKLRADVRQNDDWQVLLAERIQQVVASSCISDVPVAMAFSGGSDSVAVASCALSATQRLAAFSIYNPNSQQNCEESIRREFCEKYSIAHHSIALSPSELQNWVTKYMTRLDEPIGDNTIIYSVVLSEYIQSQGYKVFLTGEGGDEIFLGYPWWVSLMRWAKIIRVAPALATGLIPLLSRQQQRRAVARMLRSRSKGASEVYWDSQLGLADDVRQNLLGRSCIGISSNEYVTALRRQFQAEGGTDDGQWFTYLDLNLRLPELLLPRLDRASMLFGTEARSPLLERDLVELALAMPESVKLPHHRPKGGYFKYLSKKVDPHLIVRQKIGYNAGVRSSLSEYAETLAAQVIRWNRQHAFFQPSALREIVDQNPDARWPLFALAHWHGTAVTGAQNAIA